MAVKLCPLGPIFQLVLSSGAPGSGGQLFFYLAGSSTKANTYTDHTGNTANTNPVILNSLGMPTTSGTPTEIWLTEGVQYKIVYAPSGDTDPPASPIRTVDYISGINDVSVSQDQWVAGPTPTYVSGTQFTLVGDQTSTFHAGRRIKATVTAGTVYGYISVSTYTTLTTVTVVLDSGALDSGLSACSYGLLSYANTSDPSVLPSGLQNQSHIAYVTGGTSTAFTLTPSPALTAYAENQEFDVEFHTASGATPTLNISALGTKSLKYRDFTGTLQAITPLQVPSGWRSKVTYDGTDMIVREVAWRSGTVIPVRQTVLSGPVDSSGLPNFGGSTGSTTVTMSGTLIAAAAAGFGSFGATERVGSITNAAWTSLSTNGTMYLYLDIAADGSCTTGSTTLAPTYQWGGTYSTTNGQNTFNIQEMTMKVGNGSIASTVYRVFVGEVTVSGGVVSAIVWYALMGRYDSGFTATLPGTATNTSRSHNIGAKPLIVDVVFENTTTDLGAAVGDQIHLGTICVKDATFMMPMSAFSTALAVSFTSGSSVAFSMVNKSSGANGNLTAANWKYKVTCQRGW